MRYLLVNPPRLDNKIPVIREDRCEITDRYAIIPPYSLLTIASILKNGGHFVELIDANADNISYEQLKKILVTKDFDAAIFRFTPTTFKWDMKTPELIKQLNPQAITIGLCLTLHALAEWVMERSEVMDIYVPKEWESVIPNLAFHLENKHDLQHVTGIIYRDCKVTHLTGEPRLLKDLGGLPTPSFDLLNHFSKYRPNSPVNKNFMIVYSSKGCPFRCIYCTVANSTFMIKSADKLIEELGILYGKYGVRTISFFDETFTLDRGRVIALCEEIEKDYPKLEWYCNTRANLVDRELLERMKSGGCKGIAYGIESGSQVILNNANKGITVDEAKCAIKWTKQAGIKAFASFIFGLPGETRRTVDETYEFLNATLPTGAQFNVAVPYPATRLYDYAIKQGLISPKVDWENLYQHKALMRTEELSSEDLGDIRKNAYKRLYLNFNWIAQNVEWVFNNPSDLSLGVQYYIKALKNLSLHQMEHAH